MIGALLPRRSLLVPAFAIVFALFVAAALAAPTMGVTPLFGLGFLLGPLVLGAWIVLQRPLMAPIALYAALAPLDNLLNFGDGTTLTRLVALGAVTSLVLMCLHRGVMERIPRFVIAWVVALSWMIASTFWATDQQLAINKLLQIGLSIVILVLVALARSDRLDLYALAGTMVLASAALATYIVVVHPVGHAAVVNARVQVSNGRFSLDPNGLAAGLLPSVMFCIALVASRVEPWLRLSALALVPLISAAALETESRGAFVALGAGLVWIVVRSRQRLAAFGLLVGGIMLSIVQGGVWARFTEQDMTGAGRTDIWLVGLQAFRDHWFLGSGIGTFPDAYNSAYLRVPHHFYIGWSRPAHDLLVQSFTELGIIGGAMVLFAFWRQFRELASIPSNDRDAWLAVGAEAATIGTVVAALFLDMLDIRSTWILPFLIALVSNVRVREAQAVSTKAVSRPTLPERAPPAIPSTL